MLPPFIAEMEGKTFTFQVRVTAFNVTEHHKTFTITRVAEDHGRLPEEAVLEHGGDDGDDENGDSAASDLVGTGHTDRVVSPDAGGNAAGKARSRADYSGTSKVVSEEGTCCLKYIKLSFT